MSSKCKISLLPCIKLNLPMRVNIKNNLKRVQCYYVITVLCQFIIIIPNYQEYFKFQSYIMYIMPRVLSNL